MRTKVVLLVTTLVFLLASVATGFAQQNPPAQAGGGGRGGQAGGGGQGAGGGRGGQAPPPFAIMSPSITDGTALAVKYSCAAGPAAISPEIRWANPPRDAQQYSATPGRQFSDQRRPRTRRDRRLSASLRSGRAFAPLRL
jgi:hypothetical protein